MLEIDHLLLNSVVCLLDRFDKVQFFRKNGKLYVSVENRHTFDNLNMFFIMLTNYKVKELNDEEWATTFDESEDPDVYIAIIESD